MKTWPLIIGIIVILALVCSPVLAISKSDLISQYKGQSAPTIPTPIPTIPTPISPPTLTTVWLLVTSTPTRAMVFLDGSYIGFTPLEIHNWLPDGISVGTHQLRLSRQGYEDYLTEILIQEPSCHPGTGPSGDFFACEVHPITIDITLKKVGPTLKPTPTPSLEENTTITFPPWPITPAGPPPPSKLTLWIQSEKQRYIDKGICCMGADPANPLCPICPLDHVGSV